MIGLIYVLGMLSVGGALALALALGWIGPGDIKPDLVEAAIQVLVFGLAGGAIKLLLDQQAEHRRFRHDTLERLGRVHKDVYRVRRLLKSSQPQEGQQLLGQLMDARQDLGAVFHTTRLFGFGPKLTHIQTEIEAMREYLESVTDGALADKDTPGRAAYDAFFEGHKDSPYEKSFKDRYKIVKKALGASVKAS